VHELQRVHAVLAALAIAAHAAASYFQVEISSNLYPLQPIESHKRVSVGVHKCVQSVFWSPEERQHGYS
jgi:hypothetical protein